jgi:hypothetical protein
MVIDPSDESKVNFEVDLKVNTRLVLTTRRYAGTAARHWRRAA